MGEIRSNDDDGQPSIGLKKFYNTIFLNYIYVKFKKLFICKDKKKFKIHII